MQEPPPLELLLGGVASRHGVLPYLVGLGCAVFVETKLLWSGSRRELREIRFGLFFLTAWLCYWFYIGGDNFEDRFLLVLIPVATPLIVEALQSSELSLRGFVFALAFGTQLTPIVRDDRFGKHLIAKYDYGVKLGQYLRAHFHDKLLATPSAKKIPYYSGLVTIDVLGLTDRHIGHTTPKLFVPGHSKGDPEYVLSRKPDLIGAAFDGNGLDLDPVLTERRWRKEGITSSFSSMSCRIPMGMATSSMPRVTPIRRSTCLRFGAGG